MFPRYYLHNNVCNMSKSSIIYQCVIKLHRVIWWCDTAMPCNQELLFLFWHWFRHFIWIDAGKLFNGFKFLKIGDMYWILLICILIYFMTYSLQIWITISFLIPLVLRPMLWDIRRINFRKLSIQKYNTNYSLYIKHT